MQPESRLRRRVLALGMIALASFLLLLPPGIVPRGLKALMVLACAPGILLVGIVALIWPNTVPDPRPSAAIIAVSEFGSRGLVFGTVLFFIGVGLGIIFR